MKLFILLVLLNHVAIVTAVVGCLSDRDKDHRPRENCTGAGYSDVPSGFDLSTKVLLFPNNQLSRLSWHSFQIFSQIHELDLSSNKVLEVPPSSSPVLPSLSVLRLASNRLTSLPGGSFSACPGLTELYLGGNAIESLSDHTFSGLSKLEILDLSSNHIKVLPVLMLHPLPAIETLYLESNKIKEMPDDWFSQKEEVPYLYLSANPWSCSCPLLYLRRYLSDYEMNVYVRDGPIIVSDVESVVCTSPPDHEGKSIINLEDDDLCPPTDLTNPRGDFNPPRKPTPDAATTPATTAGVSTPTTAATTTSTTTSTTASTTMGTTVQSPSVPTELEDDEGSTLAESRSTIGSSSERSATMTTAAPPISTVKTDRDHLTGDVGATVREGGFCVWLFVGCLLLCMASAVCILATAARLVTWYTRAYKPLTVMLARQRGGGERVRLVGRKGEKEVAGGVTALYRSVLYIHRDGGQERTGVPLELAGGGPKEREERGVYTKTICRLVSREEEVEGWKDVMEECRIDGRRKGQRMDGEKRGGSRKRYSVILREEGEEEDEGRGERDWVVGGWEVKRGGREEPRSSWGEWLAHYLPSMPWGVAMPTEGETGH